MARILIHTLGSSGDFNPFIAIAFELKRRGHAPCFAVQPAHARSLGALGLEAIGVGPDVDPHSPEYRRLLQPALTDPIDVLFREMLIPNIIPATEILTPLVREADLFLSHTIQLAAPAIAYRTGVPWISATPATNCYPSLQMPAPSIAWRKPPAFFNRVSWGVAGALFRAIDEQANEEYRKLGVPPRRHVVVSGGYSRRLTICLWSPAFFHRPSDWPSWLQVGGYARWDAPATDSAWTRNLPPTGSSDSPLVLFTLGSNVVNDPRGYYETAVEAIRPTRWRAILLGAPADFPVPSGMAHRVFCVPYAPYEAIFPLASAIVHQGGIGTTQAACYYGIPSLVVPRGFDQFENAAHIRRNGLGLRLMSRNLTPFRLRRRLNKLLSSDEIRARVCTVGSRMRAEPGVARSVDLIEAVLASEANLRTLKLIRSRGELLPRP
ncbi:MAG: glycosyltransferase [Capsulimonadaceae bacterium]